MDDIPEKYQWLVESKRRDIAAGINTRAISLASTGTATAADITDDDPLMVETFNFIRQQMYWDRVMGRGKSK